MMTASDPSRRRVLRTTAGIAACGVGAAAAGPAGAQEVFPANAADTTGFSFQTGEEVYTTEFDDLDDWMVELEGDTGYGRATEEGFVLAGPKGTTAWLDRELSGDVLIEYEATVPTEGEHARLSDLNMFWMATPSGRAPNAPPIGERSGAFFDYNDLSLYYVGMGGNENTTTRFRDYPRRGYRNADEGNSLKGQYRDDPYLLSGDTRYTIQCLQVGDHAMFAVDGELIFRWQDPEPHTEGLFGFRSVNSRKLYHNLSVKRVTDVSVTTPSPTPGETDSGPTDTTEGPDTTSTDGPGFGAGAALLGLGAAGLRLLRD
jgi:PGF-CTERM protein